MKFNKIINEVKNDLEIGDEITLSGNHKVWTVTDEEDEYYEIQSNDDGEKTKLSKYKLSNVKKVPIFEFKTQEDKQKEIERYNKQLKLIKTQMRSFKGNSRNSEKFQDLQKRLDRTQAALSLAIKKTPRLTIY